MTVCSRVLTPGPCTRWQYIVVEGVLSAEEIAALNASLDANWDRRSLGKNSPKRTASDQMHGMLQWPAPQSTPFRNLLVHPNVTPYLNTILGPGWKMDHSPSMLHADPGADLPPEEMGGGMAVHGATAREMHGGSYYRYANDEMRSGMVVCSFQLEDMPAGDGGFGVVPGSHKVSRHWPSSDPVGNTQQRLLIATLSGAVY